MTKEEQAAADAVMKFLDCYAQKNVEGCLSALVVAKPILLMGTNDNEVFRTASEIRAAFMKDFECITHVGWANPHHIHVAAARSLASVIIERPISYENEGKEVKTLFRYALTLVKEAGQWKICAGLASVPFATGTYSFPR